MRLTKQIEGINYRDKVKYNERSDQLLGRARVTTDEERVGYCEDVKPR